MSIITVYKALNNSHAIIIKRENKLITKEANKEPQKINSLNTILESFIYPY
ncbi:hypothetical protein M2326_001357 [Flavobacterium sp. 7A]|nr:hypothetical protein [Flavobacterium sp. 7A]